MLATHTFLIQIGRGSDPSRLLTRALATKVEQRHELGLQFRTSIKRSLALIVVLIKLQLRRIGVGVMRGVPQALKDFLDSCQAIKMTYQCNFH